MTQSLEQLFSVERDFDLCDGLLLRIFKRYGEGCDVSKLPEEPRMVMLVWCASGLIENGGFQRFFECNFPGDPHYALTEAAFHAIEAQSCSDAFEEVFGLFPKSKPPEDKRRRLALYLRHRWAKRAAIDNKFFSGNRDIPRALAAYIRQNRGAFSNLE